VADAGAYSALELSPPEFTSRTRLYHLRPLGIGTSMVESLTGYIARLAAAHAVSPRALLYVELGPCAEPAHQALMPADTAVRVSCTRLTL
jgi:hypothetical protein